MRGPELQVIFWMATRRCRPEVRLEPIGPIGNGKAEIRTPIFRLEFVLGYIVDEAPNQFVFFHTVRSYGSRRIFTDCNDCLKFPKRRLEAHLVFPSTTIPTSTLRGGRNLRSKFRVGV